MRFLRWSCCLVAAVTLAQDPSDLFSKAPPAVDQALRERITKFYQAQADGKFRIADQYVAEDSKDVFFEADKRRCKTFEILRVNYFDDFARAAAVTSCDTSMLMPPRGLIEVKMPISSQWKVVEGQWFWFVPPSAGRDSAFGTMVPGPGKDGGIPTTIPRGPTVSELMSQVTTNRPGVLFTIGQANAGDVEIQSSMPGEVKLAMEPLRVEDVAVSLSKTVLNGKDSAKLHIKYAPSDLRPRFPESPEDIRIHVLPINKVLVVRVAFSK